MKICLKCESSFRTVGWKCPSCGWSPDIDCGFPLFAPEIAKGFEDFPIESHNRLATIEEQNFWFISRNKLISYLLDKYFPYAVSMMEIGCGNGFVLSGLAHQRPEMACHGAEAYPSGLIHAQKRLPRGQFSQMDACRIPFVDEFDIIGAFDVLEHISSDEKALSEMHKALKPEGGIIVSVPQHPWLWTNRDQRAGHKRRYTRKELYQKIKAAGFNVEMITSFVSLLLPFMAISRLMAKTSKITSTSKKKIPVDMRLPTNVNMFFIKLCDLERSIIKTGFSMPAGGSLVCVAKKR